MVYLTPSQFESQGLHMRARRSASVIRCSAFGAMRRRFAAVGSVFAMVVSLVVAVDDVAAATVPASVPATMDVTSRPDLMSAMVAARALGHRVEITGQDTEFTTTWANP